MRYGRELIGGSNPSLSAINFQTMTDLRIRRILKVNHAGEYGAVRIYAAQIFFCRLFRPDLVDKLTVMRDEEVDHFVTFGEAMRERQGRPCRALWLWSTGGWVMGALTALMGRNMIMVCTEAVEDAVHHHMNDQIDFLEGRDDALRTIVENIRSEEIAHLDCARDHVRHTVLTRFAAGLIFLATEVLIWLSTQGDSSRMKADLRRDRQARSGGPSVM
jgi:3-demethoxyubiquinol 3-hydroxylase